MAKVDPIQIDANMKKLVVALNRYPGITTFSSCGGHANRTNISQRPKGKFFVCFDVDIQHGGWKSLETIVWCVCNSDDFNKLDVTAWTSGDAPETLAFELNGTRSADPDALADLLILALGAGKKLKRRR